MATADSAKVRNVGILGHGGVGKTMLIERILNDVGATTRLGAIDEGNTVCDYLEEEIERKHSIALKLVNLEWNGVRIHLVDHPGYVDFIGETACSTPLLDALIILVDASTGVQVGTDNAWKYAEKHNIPRAILVNKLDREHADFDEVVAGIQDVFGKQCAPMVMPIGASADLSGVANIVTGDTSAIGGDAEALKEALVEVVAETDDELTERFLETMELTPEEFNQGLLSGISSGQVVPILAGSVSKGFGIKELLDVIADSFPTPLQRRVVAQTDKGDDVEVKVGADEPFFGQVFRSVVDPFVGHLTLFRVLSGTLKSDSEFYNVNTRNKERTGKIYLVNGKEHKTVSEVTVGDLAALTKLKHTHFGDTLTVPGGADLTMPPIELPDSMVKLAIEPKTRSDADKLGEALNRLAEEDPTFKHYRDESTGEHVIRGMGDQQLEILLARMKRRNGVEVETKTPKVAYRETVKGKAEVQGKHKKQTGGHGQYGDVHIRISGNERGAGYEFIDAIVGGVVPKQYIPHVDKGCQDALLKGVISGNPVVDVKIELFFGSYHNVDSSEMAFKLAASKAINKGIGDAKPCILEPIMEITVTMPEEYMGDINGDLNSRRGRILGMDNLGGGRQSIRANVPEADVLRYSTELRSLTQGRGSYELKFSHYDEVPDHVAKEIVAAYQKSRTEDA
jgi:elongation factor G